jgi:AraC-like DNA-binding protein
VRGVAVENPNSVLDHYARGQRRSTQELHASLLRETAEIVRAEFGRPLTLEEVARRLATSPRQLRRIFTEAGGKSFRSLLTEVRMDRAAELLEATDLSVSGGGTPSWLPGSRAVHEGLQASARRNPVGVPRQATRAVEEPLMESWFERAKTRFEATARGRDRRRTG